MKRHQWLMPLLVISQVSCSSLGEHTAHWLDDRSQHYLVSHMNDPLDFSGVSLPDVPAFPAPTLIASNHDMTKESLVMPPHFDETN